MKNLRIITITTIAALVSRTIASPHEIDFFTGKNHEGTSYRGGVVRQYCHNLPIYMNNQVSSVNTHEACVQLYSERECSGRWIELAPGTHHGDLAQLGFDKTTSSARLCDNPLVSENPMSKRIELFTGESQTGTRYTLELGKGKCHNFPHHMNKQISSVDTHGECIRLHSKPYCSGWNVDLRPGLTTEFERLEELDFNNFASSVELCDGTVSPNSIMRLINSRNKPQ